MSIANKTRELSLNRIWVKFSAIIVVLLLVLMAVVYYFFTQRELINERAELQDNMERIAKMVASIRLMETDDDSLYSDWIDRIMRSDSRQNLVYIAVFDTRQRLIAYALNAKDLAVNADLLTSEDEKEIIEENGIQRVIPSGYFGPKIIIKSPTSKEAVVNEVSKTLEVIEERESKRISKETLSITSLKPPPKKGSIKLCHICGETVRNASICPNCGARLD